MKKEIAIVLGWNYSTALGVVRSLGMAGYHVELFYIAKSNGDSKITASSKYLKRTIEHIGRNDESIIATLHQEYGSLNMTCILIPTDDYSSSLLDRYYSLLSPMFLLPHTDRQGGITRLMDKSIQADLAQKSGLRTIGYHKVFLPVNGEILLPSGVQYPCFIKPVVSLDGRKTEMKKCDSKEQVLSHLSLMRSNMNNREVIIQEFLDIQEEFSISGVCLNQAVFMPALLKRLYVGKYERGVTIVGELIDITTEIDFENNLVQLLKSLHYTGLFCIDLIKANGVVYFSEINFRSAGSLYGFVKAGANLPAILLSELTKKNFDISSVSIKLGTRFFYDKVGWEDLLYGFCTLKDFMHYMAISDFTLMKDDMDTKPGRLLYRSMSWKYIKKRLRLFLNM